MDSGLPKISPALVDCTTIIFKDFNFICVFVLSFPILLIKYYKETHRRSFKVWWFDVSKIVMGYFLLHFIPAYYIIADENINDIKKQYWLINFMELLMDGIFVTAFSYLFVLMMQNISGSCFKLKNFQFIIGLYPNGFKSWIYQLAIWALVLVMAKFLVFGIIYFFYVPLYFISYFLMYLVHLPFYYFNQSWKLMFEEIAILIIVPWIINIIVLIINVS